MKYVMTEAVATQEMNGQFMLYDSENGLIHVLNETAGVIVQLIQQGHHDLAGIVQEFRKEYELPLDYPLEGDIEEALNQLVEMEVLRVE